MKILETPQKPEFKPVTVVFETPEELQYVTKLIGRGSMTLFKQITGYTGETPFSYHMYNVLCEECEKQNIECSDLH